MHTHIDESQRNKLKRNLRLVLALGFFQVFLVVIPILVPLFQGDGLSMQEVFLLQAWFGLVVVLMEVPSGYAADTFGRKRTLVVGSLFLALGHSTLLVADGFWGYFLFEGLLGLAVSLLSGADLALLYDTELTLGRDDESPQAVSNLYAMHSWSEALGGVACSLLMLHSMHAVVVAQVLVGVVPLLLSLWLVEPQPQEGAQQQPLRIGEVFRHLLVGNAVLRLTVLALSLWSLTTFFAVWLLPKYWEQEAIPLTWFGYLWAFYTVSAGIAGRWANRLERWLGAPALLTVAAVLPVLGYAGMAVLPLGLGLIAALAFFVARGLGLVVLRDALNRRVPSRFRATANSLASFGFRGAFVLTGPAVGALYDHGSLELTLWVLVAGSAVVSLATMAPLIGEVRRLRAGAAAASEAVAPAVPAALVVPLAPAAPVATDRG